MDFRNAIIRTASAVDLSMDPMSPDASLPQPREQYTPPPSSDGQDPATPGGPAPYNAAEPVGGAPVADDPMLPEPTHDPNGRMPYTGPGADVNTLINHRHARYASRRTRRHDDD